MKAENILPRVKKYIEKSEKYFSFRGETGIDLADFPEWCVNVFFARSEIKRNDYKKNILLHRERKMKKEEYRLVVQENQIDIYAGTENGVIWALTTLAEIMDDGRIKECEIEDIPDYEHRGLSLDCVRHFFTVEEVKKVIEEISLAKMNVFHWHLTNDQGWRIESRKFPKLQELSKEYYTQEQIREVCEFARRRGVEIIPEIEMPGHVSSILAAYPEYSCSGKKVSLAATGGIYPVIFCAGNEKTYDFLQELLGEIMELFLGERIHLGGDEVPKKEWKNCPCCQKKMKEMNYSDYEELQGYFATRVADLVKENKKMPVYWNESVQSEVRPTDIQVQYWTLQHRTSMEKYADQKKKWIYSDMFELYLDYPYSMTNLRKVYETVPHLGEREVSAKDGLIGMEGAVWAEHIRDDERLENLLFPRIYALAEILWSGAGDYEEFEERLQQFITSKLHKNIRYTDRSWWVPQGKERQKEAFEYMADINAGMSDEVRAETVESAAPNEEFAEAFMKKFFQPEDLAALMGRVTE